MTTEGRDLTWDAMYEVAARLSQSGRAGELSVEAVHRRRLFVVTEGLWVGDKWVDVFESIRKRAVFSSTWQDVHSVADAASKIGQFLDERPDRD